MREFTILATLLFVASTSVATAHECSGCPFCQKKQADEATQQTADEANEDCCGECSQTKGEAKCCDEATCSAEKGCCSDKDCCTEQECCATKSGCEAKSCCKAGSCCEKTACSTEKGCCKGEANKVAEVGCCSSGKCKTAAATRTAACRCDDCKCDPCRCGAGTTRVTVDLSFTRDGKTLRAPKITMDLGGEATIDLGFGKVIVACSGSAKGAITPVPTTDTDSQMSRLEEEWLLLGKHPHSVAKGPVTVEDVIRR